MISDARVKVRIKQPTITTVDKNRGKDIAFTWSCVRVVIGAFNKRNGTSYNFATQLYQ